MKANLDHDAVIRRIEKGLPSAPPVGTESPNELTLQKLMELYKIPGLSIAVIDTFKIVWAKGYGVTETGISNPVTTQTLFQAGSVSKAVTATGALRLVEEGKIPLDEDVNSILKNWKVPDNEFTKEQKVTLRHILSHSAGLTVHFFPGYAVNDPMPTLVQILDGQLPANTAPIRVGYVPGSKWSYSGGGLLVAQQIMIDATSMLFPQIMRESVFERIGMNDSSFEHPLPAAQARLAASGTHWNGNTVEGKWHLYPEMAAAGLWSTPSDLARCAIEIALAKNGKSNSIISQSMAREMLKPQIEGVTEFALGNSKHPDRMGLGFFLGDETRPNLFGHIGNDAGFEAMLIMDSESGQGAAIMANSEVGILLGDCLLEIIAKEYGWNDFIQPDRPRAGAGAVLLGVFQEKGLQSAIQQYWAIKQTDVPQFIPDQNTLLMFSYYLAGIGQPDAAIEVMNMEVQEFPTYWNAYDSLAELYEMVGEKDLAIQNYEKSVQINPDNWHAVERLKKLKELK